MANLRRLCCLALSMALCLVFDSESAILAESPSPGPVEPRLLGVWRQVDGDSDIRETFELTASKITWAVGDRFKSSAPVIGQQGEELVWSWWGHHQLLTLVWHDRTLTVERPLPNRSDWVPRRFELLASRPDYLDPRPLPLGDAARALEPGRVEALKREIIERGAKDQAIRQDGQLSLEEKSVDRDNTAFLKALITEIGWINRERFGPEAALAAFAIVQHSEDVALMLAALPHIGQEARESEEASWDFAMLFDRTQLRLGRKQRYGTQLSGGRYAPLENPAKVDDIRAEVGLPPIQDKENILSGF